MYIRSAFFGGDFTRRVADVSEQPTGSIFKDQAVHEERLALQDGTDRLYRNVGEIIPLHGA